MKSWPEDWDERRRGRDCPMCAGGRPDEDRFGIRVFEGAHAGVLRRRPVHAPPIPEHELAADVAALRALL